MLRLIDRFGYDAAHTGNLGEMRRMLAAESVYSAFQGRESYRDQGGSENWTEWAGKYPGANRILEQAARIAEELENDGDR